ncbi:hypothetical protein GCM10027062_26530 [Nocardioides hungaricus]
MDLYTGLTPFVVVLLVVGVAAAVAALGVVAEFVVRNRRIRLARHESVRAYYRGLAPTH